MDIKCMVTTRRRLEGPGYTCSDNIDVAASVSVLVLAYERTKWR